MSSNKNRKLIAGSAALVLALGLGVAAIGTSTAYFSESVTTATSTVTGDQGSIDITTEAPTLEYADLLPGVPASQTFTVTNTGENAQDLWITFDDPAALADLNELLANSSMVISVDGTTVYDSESDGDLDSQVKLTADLESGQTASVTVGFMIDADYESQASTKEAPIALPYTIVATQTGITPAGTPAA